MPGDVIDLAEGRIQEEYWDLAGLRPQRKEAIRAESKPLPWLTALSQLWKPLHEAGRSPGRELLYAVLSNAAMAERDLEDLKRYIGEAGRTPGLIKKQLPEQLRAARKGADDREKRAFCDLLLKVLEETECVAKVRKKGGAVLVHRDTLPLALWTIENLDHFLKTYWALYRTFEARIQRLVTRYRSFQEIKGAFHGLGNLSENHSLLWDEGGGDHRVR